MKELNQRREKLSVTEDEWVAVWMLSIIKKRKRLDKYIYQALRDIVKLGGVYVINNYKRKDVEKMVLLQL